MPFAHVTPDGSGIVGLLNVVQQVASIAHYDVVVLYVVFKTFTYTIP